jgi:peptidyl-prolyl cis-trans isomerase-like 4
MAVHNQDIAVILHAHAAMHLTCCNGLLSCRVKYYNNCIFHNVQRNFIAQTGDPTGTGKGGESVYG